MSHRHPALFLLLLGALGAADWPGWRGRGDGCSADTGVRLVEDLAQAQLLWQSEERIPGTYEGDARKGVPRLQARIPGGYASPIVAGDRLFLFYYEPNGPTHATEVTAKIVGQGGLGREAWTTDADEVLLCVDAAEGRTLWKRVLVERGFNLEAGFNKGGGQFTPCHGDGRVYALGTSARVFCVDADDGRLLWESDIGIRSRYVDIRKDGWRERQTIGGGRNDFAGCVLLAGGVLAVSDHQEFKNGPRGMGKSNGLVGFDASTGAVRWYVPGAGGSGMLTATPLRWAHGEKEYIVASGWDGLYGIDPTDGRVLWTHAGAGFSNAAAISGDHLVCEAGKQITCLRLSPTGATVLWTEGEGLGFTSPVIRSGHLFAVAGKAGLQCRDLASGKLLGSLPQEGISGSLAGADGVSVCAASARGKAGLNLFRADPSDFRQLGERLDIPFANSTTPAIVDGRVYLRGRDRLLCLDLRAAP